MRPPETLSSSFPFSCPAAKLHDLARIGPYPLGGCSNA